ncbi:MAG: HAMP domain-containing histidine kinase [Actinobacteria bacterium]|nr:HAMP domain-containing histidine kinase [Actinomycetota bacterium]
MGGRARTAGSEAVTGDTRAEGGTTGRRGLSLRTKYYLFILPLVIIILALMATLVGPATRILARIPLVRIDAQEISFDQQFRVAYERAILDLNSFALTGTLDFENDYRDAREDARAALEGWAKAIRTSPGLDRRLRDGRLKDLGDLERAYQPIDEACERADSLVREGRSPEALRVLEEEAEAAVSRELENRATLIEDERAASLMSNVRYLEGVVGGAAVYRMLGMQDELGLVAAHLANTVTAGRFATACAVLFKEFQDIASRADEAELVQAEEARGQADSSLAALDAQATDLPQGPELTRLRDDEENLRISYEALLAVGLDTVELALTGRQEDALEQVRADLGSQGYGAFPGQVDAFLSTQRKAIEGDLDRISSTATRTLWGVALLALLVLVFALLVPWLLSRKIVRPILRLTEAASLVGAGDFGARVEVASRDELGDLADTFNKMAGERERAEEVLETRVEERTGELALANEALDAYAHTVSHDLKGPLSAAIMASTNLQRVVEKRALEPERDYIARMLGLMSDSLESSSALIDDVLALAEAGQRPLKVGSVDVSGVVGRILAERQGALAEKHVRVEVDAEPGTVAAEATHVYQVFSNLIGNAIRHNDSDTPLIEVRRLPDADGGAARLLVRDNGSGIPPESLEQVFTPFYRMGGGGSGIGLAVVRRILEAYGGGIRAYNDRGACFELTWGPASTSSADAGPET